LSGRGGEGRSHSAGKVRPSSFSADFSFLVDRALLGSKRRKKKRKKKKEGGGNSKRRMKEKEGKGTGAQVIGGTFIYPYTSLQLPYLAGRSGRGEKKKKEGELYTQS